MSLEKRLIALRRVSIVAWTTLFFIVMSDLAVENEVAINSPMFFWVAGFITGLLLTGVETLFCALVIVLPLAMKGNVKLFIVLLQLIPILYVSFIFSIVKLESMLSIHFLIFMLMNAFAFAIHLTTLLFFLRGREKIKF